MEKREYYGQIVLLNYLEPFHSGPNLGPIDSAVGETDIFVGQNISPIRPIDER
jgi:hypothetical protein